MNIRKIFSLKKSEKLPDQLVPKNITFRLEQVSRLPEIWLLVWNISHYLNVTAIEAIKQSIIEYHLKHVQSRFDKLDENCE